MNSIGDSNIKFYQKFGIITGIIILVIFSSLFFLNFVEGEIILYIALFLALIVFLYSRIYEIKYDEKYFYISNIYKKIEVPVDEFKKIREAVFLPLTYRIKFSSSTYHFMIKSNAVYKKFFSFGGQRTDDKLTEEIKKNLNILN